MAVGQWIMVSSMPTKLRPYALNPTTAGSAAQVALNDPETDKMTFGVGIAVAWVLMAWTTIVTFRCLGFVHDLGGWRFAVAILFSILLTVPISTVTMRMASLLHEQP
jgi:hypothetical protein